MLDTSWVFLGLLGYWNEMVLSLWCPIGYSGPRESLKEEKIWPVWWQLPGSPLIKAVAEAFTFFSKSSSCELKSKWETRIQEDSSIPSVVNVAYSHRKSPVLGPGQMVSSECRSRFSQGVSTCVNEFLHLGIRTFPVWMWLWYWRYWHIINFYTYFCHLDPFGPSNYPLFTLEVASINFLCRWTCPTSNSRLTPAPSLRRVLGHWTGSVHPGNVVLGGNRFVAPAVMTCDDCAKHHRYLWHLCCTWCTKAYHKTLTKQRCGAVPRAHVCKERG